VFFPVYNKKDNIFLIWMKNRFKKLFKIVLFEWGFLIKDLYVARQAGMG